MIDFYILNVVTYHTPGGAIAEKVFQALNGSNMVIFSYDPRIYTGKSIQIVSSVDKLTVIQSFANSSYYLYPVSLPDGKVHKVFEYIRFVST